MISAVKSLNYEEGSTKSPLSIVPTKLSHFNYDSDIDKTLLMCDKTKTIREQLKDQIFRMAENFIRPRIEISWPDENRICHIRIYETVIINEDFGPHRQNEFSQGLRERDF